MVKGLMPIDRKMSSGNQHQENMQDGYPFKRHLLCYINLFTEQLRLSNVNVVDII